MIAFRPRPVSPEPLPVDPDGDGRLAVKLRIAAVAGPLVDQAILGRLTGRIRITVDFDAGRPLLVEPAIRWK